MYLPRHLYLLLTSLIWPQQPFAPVSKHDSGRPISSPTQRHQQHLDVNVNNGEPAEIVFELRHFHALTDDGKGVVFSNVHSRQPSASPPPGEEAAGAAQQLIGFSPTSFTVPTRSLATLRPSSFSALQDARRLIANRTRPHDFWAHEHEHAHRRANIRNSRIAGGGGAGDRGRAATGFGWEEEDVVGPRTEKRQTLVQLAKMTFNAFYDGPEAHQEWYKLDSHWNMSMPFGWEPTSDGLRGQIFASADNSTVIIALKGTSAPWVIGGDSGPTKGKDKLNNNMLFSCCCARVGPSWSPVCGCFRGDNKCGWDCVESAMVEDSLFYSVGVNLYNSVAYMYPNANIWLTGHSLGGSLASLLGVTFGAPTVTFGAPGDRLAAQRLHLPSVPSMQHIIQVYHTADPVPIGECTGVFSLCAIGGYAIETKCHLGQVIKYDTVKQKGWGVSVRNHPIQILIDSVLSEEWDPAEKEGREVPEPELEEDCNDCADWVFV